MLLPLHLDLGIAGPDPVIVHIIGSLVSSRIVSGRGGWMSSAVVSGGGQGVTVQARGGGLTTGAISAGGNSGSVISARGGRYGDE